MRDVEAASGRIAARHGNEDFAISPSRLSDIETKGILPNEESPGQRGGD